MNRLMSAFPARVGLVSLASLAAFAALVSIAGATPPGASAEAPPADATVVGPASPGPSPRDAARARLLDLGMDAANAIPVDPHERDRARVQEVVARAALAVGDVDRARRGSEAMTTWRQGMIFCELAVEAAKRGDRAGAERLIGRANALGPRVRDWQRDRLRAAVGRAQAELGAEAEVRELEALVGEAERGKVTAARAATEAAQERLRSSREEFDAILAEARRAVDSGSFDAAANGLETCIALAATADGDEERWSAIDAVFAAANGKVAREIAIRAILRLADVRIDDGAKAAAARLVAQARAVRDEVRWTPDDDLPLTAEIARRMAKAEGAEPAVAELERGLAVFRENEAKVADVFRAQALNPAAEALVELGSTERALEVFRWAIEAGAINPNARPRAEDLAQTCAALARAGVVPDEAMWSRLRAIRDGLMEPW